MSTELTVLNNSTDLQQGGLGIDTTNKLFQLKPSTLIIVQPGTTIEGANKGNLRISETGDEFKDLECSLLIMPTEQRACYSGEPGELNKIPENLMCFSRDMVKPDPKAKIPQAMFCNGCPQSDWKAWQDYKKDTGKSNKALAPRCQSFYIVHLIDTKYQLPLRMYIRAKAKQTFEQGTQNIARMIAMAKAQKKNPNLFDVKFKLSTKLVVEGQYKYYVPTISEWKFISDEEREAFGAIYNSFIEQQAQINASQAQVQNTEQANKVEEVITGDYVGENEEITI